MIVEEIKLRFPDFELHEHAARRLYLTVPRERLGEVGRFLFLEKGARLSTATGTDTRAGFELLYHFSLDTEGTFVSVRTVVPKDDPNVESLASFMPAANWIEREIFDLVGVVFLGHPNLKRLLSAEDVPEDHRPLRRDFDGNDDKIKPPRT